MIDDKTTMFDLPQALLQLSIVAGLSPNEVAYGNQLGLENLDHDILLWIVLRRCFLQTTQIVTYWTHLTLDKVLRLLLFTRLRSEVSAAARSLNLALTGRTRSLL